MTFIEIINHPVTMLVLAIVGLWIGRKIAQAQTRMEDRRRLGGRSGSFDA